MAKPLLSIKVTGLEAAVREIKQLPPKLQGPHIEKLGLDVRDEIRERTFDKGLDVRDKQMKWKVKPRERSYLHDTGDLERSVLYNSARKRVEVSGDAAGKAEAHQFGRGPAYRRDRRPRKFFGVSPAGETRLNKKTTAAIAQTVRKWAAGSRHWKVDGKPVRGSKPLRVTR